MKRLFFLLFTFGCVFVAFSQVAVDLFDPFYADLTDWENEGLINYAPNMRPLPLQEIERILNLVMEAGNERERRVATEHHARIFGRAFHFGVSSELGFGLSKGSSITYFDFAPMVDFNYKLAKLFSLSLKFDVHGTNKIPTAEPNPKFLFSKRDISNDDVSIGKLYILPSIKSGITLGNAEYYFSANIARTSYGPFYDSGIFVSSHAKNHGQFNLVLNNRFVSYVQSFLPIAATNGKGGNTSPHKFLSIHSLHVRPFEWLSFGLVDSVIYGKRFEPIYLIPFSVFFVSQGIYDFPDNSLIGIDFTVKPIDGLRIDGALYADDMGFNDIVKFKKDFKARMSGQFGISYTMPKKHWFRSVALDYTLVTPFAYTHISGNDGTDANINYENYTHSGQVLATNLNPNSDRLNLKLQFEPIDSLKITLNNTFIRHANINESVTDPRFLLKYMTESYNTTGTVFNHASIDSPDKNGYSDRLHLFQHATPFLKQQTIEYINQLSLEVSSVLPIKRSGGYMKFIIGYCFEADINPGVNNPMFSKTTTSTSWLGAVLSEVEQGNFLIDSGSTGSHLYQTQEVIDEANRQKAEWRAKALGKKFNHYLKLGATFAY